ncbi:NAD-dependent epimerase/dehydratase family protein [Streptomyces sp. NPDC087532]|uniref:NAD-dependent epimerase/dehydratase family protein n=1 Tax=Streptomyces sp. NPDC087532 TaxID=3365795 RepID=UPI0038025389
MAALYTTGAPTQILWCCSTASRAGLRCRIVTTLINGGSGFLGAELIRQAAAAGQPTAATYTPRPGNTARVAWHHLDLRDPGQADAVMAVVRPRLIVNASNGEADWRSRPKAPCAWLSRRRSAVAVLSMSPAVRSSPPLSRVRKSFMQFRVGFGPIGT